MTYPDHTFTDRGPGYYHPSSGTINPEYLAALEANGFKAWAGEHSKWQPPDLADVLLHETVVSWVRKYLKQHPIHLTSSMPRNITRLKDLLEEAVSHINTYYEVEDLCHSLPRRLSELKDGEGERLKY